MFVYWGFRHYGRKHLECLFRYNRKSVTEMQLGQKDFGIVHKWSYEGNTQHYDTFYKLNKYDNIQTYRESFDATSDELLDVYTDLGLKINFIVENDYLGYGKHDEVNYKRNDKSKLTNYKTSGTPLNYALGGANKDVYCTYSNDGYMWHRHYFEDIATSDLFIPTMFSTVLTYQPFIDHLKKQTNYIGTKSDILELMIARINLCNVDTTNKVHNINVSNVVEAYNIDREIVFSDLDHFISMNRRVEQKLRETKIPYDYFDLDNDSYTQFCDNLLPRRYTCFSYDKNTERYQQVENIAKQYIFHRKLTDIRLTGRITDSIS